LSYLNIIKRQVDDGMTPGAIWLLLRLPPVKGFSAWLALKPNNTFWPAFAADLNILFFAGSIVPML